MAVYSIKQAGERLRLHPETLRRWEKAKLIPAPRRDRNGSRVYDEPLLSAIVEHRDRVKEPPTQ